MWPACHFGSAHKSAENTGITRLLPTDGHSAGTVARKVSLASQSFRGKA
jgi:hypothetical protein